MKNNISGLGVALVTPFTPTGDIDFAALERLVDHVICGGADYLVTLGTTAETPTLSCEEKRSLVDAILKYNAGRVPVIVGIGGNSTHCVISAIKEFDFTGICALLSVVPYYNKPSQQGIYEHYKAVAEASPVPVILYNVPGRTGVNMTAETTLRIARDCPNAMAVKEASGNLSQIAYIMRDKPEGFAVISGDDNMTLPVIAMGGNGIISVAANAYPDKLKALVDAFAKGDTALAAKLHLDLTEVNDALFEEGNPVGVKAALAVKGIIGNYLRLPLVPSSERLYSKLQKLISTL